jgi:dolichyl-phosphate beta-glucosyltransferase
MRISPTALGPALELIADGWEVVVGSRRCEGASYAVAPSLFRRSGSWCFRRLAQPYVGSVADTQCGFKLFTGGAARALFARAEITSFAFDVEIIARALQGGYRVVELPISWSDEKGSTFRPLKDGISSFRDLTTLRRVLAVGG